MKHRAILLGAIVTATAFANAVPAAAQPFSDPSVPNYTRWQAAWDLAAFHNRHIIVGEVIDFRAYRIRLRRSNGVLQGVDLKHGTSILPTGATPTPGEHVALIGYYSRGIFIVNRLVIR